MDILFVFPSSATGNDSNSVLNSLLNSIFIFEKSLTFMILGSLTPKKHNIELVEGRHKDIDYTKNYDMVAITCITKTVNLAYEIADEFRKRGVKVVLGGWHASALPDEAIQHADSVMIGEAEEIWHHLLKDCENGNLKRFYMQTRPVDPELIPPPRTDFYPKNTRISIMATRGCPTRCEFCSISNQKYRHIFRKRPISKVIEEINSIPNKVFHFNDNSMTIDIKYTKELFREMKGLNKKFIAYGNIGPLNRDEELLKLAREAGCIGWRIGFESISQESLDCVGKTTNKAEEYLSSIKKLHDYGAAIIGTFVFGLDSDTVDIFDKTDEFVRKSEIDNPYYHVLVPVPGSITYNKLDAEGRIFDKDWNKYDSNHVVFHPRNMTKDELHYNLIRNRRRLHKKTRSLERMINSLRYGLYPFYYSSSVNFITSLGKYHLTFNNEGNVENK